MVLNQQIRKRKASGGKYKLTQRKKKYSLGRDPTLTKVGEKTIRKVRVRGGSEKLRLISGNMANVLDQKTKTYKKVKIEMVKENPGNRHYVRRNIMTKGTIIKTEIGEAKITSRPGQHGIVNAVLKK